jgi:hypothetical protein
VIVPEGVKLLRTQARREKQPEADARRTDELEKYQHARESVEGFSSALGLSLDAVWAALYPEGLPPNITESWRTGEYRPVGVSGSQGRSGVHYDRLRVEATYLLPGDVAIRVSRPDGSPPPRLVEGREPSVISPLLIQSLSGIRSMLLVLVDASGGLCRQPDGRPDPDYIGMSSGEGVQSAFVKMSLWDLTDFVPNCKYWKDYPMASFLANPLPKVPATWEKHGLQPQDCLFSGPLGTFWRRLCQPAPSGWDATLLFRAVFSIAQSKKGFFAVPDSFVDDSLVKHEAILTTKETPIENFEELDQFLKVLFRHFRPKDRVKKLARKEGSISASAVVRRSAGGAREEVRQSIGEVMGIAGDTLLRMVETSRGPREERGSRPLTLQEWRDFVSRPIRPDYQSLSDPTYQAIPAWAREAHMPFCRVQSICEPLKVRNITAMTGESSFFVKPLQEAIWDYLATFPCFQLITKPFTEGSLDDLVRSHRQMFGEAADEDPFVSGDYSSATDKIKISATLRVALHLIKALAEEDKILIPHIRCVLEPQILVYPVRKGGAVPTPTVAIQENGQLMGSVLSFPILCILNLFTYFRSLPRSKMVAVYNGSLSIKKLPVLINGDDILFRCRPGQYDVWVYAAKDIGLELSLGKNFVHKRFLTVNSLPVEYHPRPVRPAQYQPHNVPTGMTWVDYDELPLSAFQAHRGSDCVEVLGYPNIGLLIGTSKLGGRVERISGNQREKPLNGWYAGAVMGAMYPDKMHNYFLHYHADMIKTQTQFGSQTLNLFAHPLLGGLGFPVPRGVTPRFSEPQRALASKLLEAAKVTFHGHPADHPLKSFTYLSTEGLAPQSLGSKPGHVRTRLGPLVGPLPENESLFVDNSLIRTTPLAMAYGDTDDLVLAPSCRLSNGELGRLLRTANHQRMSLLPVEEMTTFPYAVVLFDEEPEDVVLTSLPLSLERSVNPGLTSALEELTPLTSLPRSVSSFPPPPPLAALEDWEYPHLPYLEEVRTKKARELYSLEHQLAAERKRAHRVMMSMRAKEARAREKAMGSRS